MFPFKNKKKLIYKQLNFKLYIMKTEIFEIDYPALGLSNSCVTFNSTKKTQKILANHSYSITGICILTLNTGETNTYKFTFSCIGDDGTIDVVTEQFSLDRKVVKSSIVNYAINLVTNKGE